MPDPGHHFARNAYCVLGIAIDALNMSEVLARIRADLERDRRLVILTPNTNDVIQSASAPPVRAAFLVSDLSLVDGMPLVWLAIFLGLPITVRVSGADLFEAVQLGQAGQMTVMFYGGGEGAAQRACERVNRSSGPLRCVGAVSPGFGSVQELGNAHYLNEVNAAHPDLLVLSLGKNGKPWVLEHATKVKRGVIAHLGAVINFAAGSVIRAPKLLQRTGLEWAWRIWQEPSLWGRYAGDAVALARLVCTRILPLKFEQIRLRRDILQDGATMGVEQTQEAHLIRLEGCWTRPYLEQLRNELIRASNSKKAFTFDMSHVEYLDSAVIGTIMLAYGWQLRSGGAFSIQACSSRATRILKLHCCEFLLEPLLAAASHATDG